MIDFTEEQIQRYSRHILLQDVGVEGQEKILNAKVLIVGAGGLGAPVGLYLAAAGVGRIGIVDADVVDLSNLQRQVIHFTKDVGVPKVESAKEKMLAINPDVTVDTYHEFLDSSNALDIIKEYDFVVDGTDNFPVKFLINDACVMAGKPFSHGGILRFNGQTFTHLPGTACYRCMFKEPPPPGCAHLLAGWGARRHRRHARHHPGGGDTQVFHRSRRAADQPSSHLRRQDHAVPHCAGQTSRLLRHLRDEPYHRPPH